MESSPANIGALANVEFQEEAPIMAFTNPLSTAGRPYERRGALHRRHRRLIRAKLTIMIIALSATI